MNTWQPWWERTERKLMIKEEEEEEEEEEELTKDWTWKAVGAFDKVCLNYLEIISEHRRRRKKRM